MLRITLLRNRYKPEGALLILGTLCKRCKTHRAQQELTRRNADQNSPCCGESTNLSVELPPCVFLITVSVSADIPGTEYTLPGRLAPFPPTPDDHPP